MTASFRCQDIVDNRLAIYVGDSGIGINPRLAPRYREADLLLVAGARLGESTTSGYTLVDIPVPQLAARPRHPDPEELGRVYHPTLADRHAACPDLAAGLRALEPVDGAASPTGRRRARRLPREPGAAGGRGDGVDLTAVALRALARAARRRDHHERRGQLHRLGAPLLQYRDYRTQLAPTTGSMGYGAARGDRREARGPRARGGRLAGDGCLMMVVGELATAVQYGAAIVVIVVEQRHVRHDPHAPGAAVSRPRLGHRPAQPRLRRARAALRRPTASRSRRTEDFADGARARPRRRRCPR